MSARRSFTLSRAVACGLAAVAAWTPAAWGQNPTLVAPEDMPGPLSEVTVEQQLGAQLPLDSRFIDQDGREVRLGDYFQDGKPVIVSFVYYECPMLCTLILNGVATSLSVLKLEPGDDFEVVAISFDSEETPAMAHEARRKTLERFGRPDAEDGWNFLVGDEATVSQAAEIAGYGYEYIPATDEWAHASAIVVATPEGEVSQYYYGIEYPPKDLRLALVEASEGRLGNMVDQLLLYCYRYDPQIGKYTAVAMRMVRLAGIVFVVALSLFLWLMFRWERRRAGRVASLGAA
ncbi:MAG: SCO family protein [Acidobacteriota bacterium]